MFEANVMLDLKGGLKAGACVVPQSIGTHAVVIGKISHYNLPATAARASIFSTAVMLVTLNSNKFQRSGFALLREEDTSHWPV